MVDTPFRHRQPPIVTSVYGDMLVELVDTVNKNRPVYSSLSTLLGGGAATIVETSTGLTLTAADSGKIYVNIGAVADITFNLPAADMDLWFGFVLVEPFSMKLNPTDTEYIGGNGDILLAGKYVEMLTPGAMLLAVYKPTIWTPEQDSCVWHYEI